VRSHMPLVRATARRYSGRGEDLDDLVQVGALGLVKASTRFDPDRGVAFASYAAPAVEGAIRRHLRDRTAPGAPGKTAGTDTAGDQPADDSEPTAESEYRLLVAGGMRALDQREQRIVFLRFHADMTERQIARELGISQAHVSRLLGGALGKLRAELAGSSEAETPGDIAESAVISPEMRTKMDSVRARGRRVVAQSEPGEGQPDDAVEARIDQPPAGHSTTRTQRNGKTKAGYSGRILVRMPGELHEQLVHAAEREDVSLNRYVTQALSSSVDPETATGTDSPRPAAKGRSLRLAVATNLAIVVIAAVVAVVLLVLALQRGL
jgi:RNA polymerase sigma-B factor